MEHEEAAFSLVYSYRVFDSVEQSAFAGSKSQYSSTQLKFLFLNLFPSNFQDLFTPKQHTSVPKIINLSIVILSESPKSIIFNLLITLKENTWEMGKIFYFNSYKTSTLPGLLYQ